MNRALMEAMIQAAVLKAAQRPDKSEKFLTVNLNHVVEEFRKLLSPERSTNEKETGTAKAAQTAQKEATEVTYH